MYQCALILIKRQQSSARRRLANPAQARGLLLRLVLTKLAGRIDLRVLAQHRRRLDRLAIFADLGRMVSVLEGTAWKAWPAALLRMCVR